AGAGEGMVGERAPAEWTGLGGRRAARSGSERPALDEEDVEVAVAVVVEEGGAAAQDLRVVELPGPAVGVAEGQPPLGRAVDEERPGGRRESENQKRGESARGEDHEATAFLS